MMIAALALAILILATPVRGTPHPTIAPPRYGWGCEPVTLIDGTPIVTCHAPRDRR